MAGNVSTGVPMGSLMIRDGDGNRLYDVNPVVISTPKAGQTSVIYLQMPDDGRNIDFWTTNFLSEGVQPYHGS